MVRTLGNIRKSRLKRERQGNRAATARQTSHGRQGLTDASASRGDAEQREVSHGAGGGWAAYRPWPRRKAALRPRQYWRYGRGTALLYLYARQKDTKLAGHNAVTKERKKRN